MSRYYDPVSARFITEDTYRGSIADPLSLNLYTYCHNEPIMYWDPTGHVEANLRDLVDAAKGTIKWDNDTRTATATINGIEQEFKINDYKVEEGRIIIDSEKFDSIFSNSKVYISSTVEDKTISVTTVKYNNSSTYYGGPSVTIGSTINNYKKPSSMLTQVTKGTGNAPSVNTPDGLTLTEDMKKAGVKVVTIDGKQYYDYTEPINTVFYNAGVEASKHKGNLVWFKSMVDHEADWDIKRIDPWERTVGTPFPGSHDTTIVVHGSLTTPEELGNIMYGYTGTAAAIPQPILIAGSIYAAGIGKVITSKDERTNEFNDHAAIRKGIKWYKEK